MENKEELKSIKTKIKSIDKIIIDYQKSYDKNQKEIDLILKKYNKNKSIFICVTCCQKFYNKNDFLEHHKTRCTPAYFPMWCGNGDYDRTLVKFIKAKYKDDKIIESKNKELKKLNKSIIELENKKLKYLLLLNKINKY